MVTVETERGCPWPVIVTRSLLRQGGLFQGLRPSHGNNSDRGGVSRGSDSLTVTTQVKGVVQGLCKSQADHERVQEPADLLCVDTHGEIAPDLRRP